RAMVMARHRGTEFSNPFPSSRQSVSLRISPPPQEKRGFSAILAAVRSGSVGRDAQSPAISRRGGVVSLSGDISVPQLLPDAICKDWRRRPQMRSGYDLGGAWSSDRLTQSRAGSVE